MTVLLPSWGGAVSRDENSIDMADEGSDTGRVAVGGCSSGREVDGLVDGGDIDIEDKVSEEVASGTDVSCAIVTGTFWTDGWSIACPMEDGGSTPVASTWGATCVDVSGGDSLARAGG